MTPEEIAKLVAGHPALARELKRAEEQVVAAAAAVPFLAQAGDAVPAPKDISPHTAYADALVTFEAETVRDALDMLERVETNSAAELMAACSSTTYRASFVPAEEFERRTKGKSGEPADSAPWWCKVESHGCEVHAYARSGDHVVHLRIKIAKPEIRATARRVEYMGGFRYEDGRVVGAEPFFANKRRMWTSPEYIPGWVLY